MKTNDMVIYPKDWGFVNRKSLRYNQKVFRGIRRSLGYSKYHMLYLSEVCKFADCNIDKAREMIRNQIG